MRILAKATALIKIFIVKTTTFTITASITMMVWVVSVAAGCGGSANTENRVLLTDLPRVIKAETPVELADGPPPKTLVVNDLKRGTGAEAKLGDFVAINYAAIGYKAKKVLLSTWGDEPFHLPVGGGMSVPILDQGVQGMRVGGRRELIAPARLIYGKEAGIYIVELIKIE